MNDNIDSELTNSLIRLHEDDDAAKRIFSWFDERRKDSWEMPVRIAAYRTGLSERDVRRVFRALAELECGRLIKGRGEHGETRMAWSLSIRSIAAAAIRGEQGVGAVQASPEDTLEAELVAEEGGANALPDGTVKHLFKLRANFEVSICLPEDLTTHEAERLGRFLQALPLS